MQNHGYRLLSTGGTARALTEAGLPVTEVGDHTGFPEIMEGRVKTLHPMVHGGLLCRRDSEEHLNQAKEHGIALIDLVVVNLYPFEETIARPKVTREEAIEQIDIGGPSMLRSAAKNHSAVTVVTDPSDYELVLEAMGDEAALNNLRKGLAIKVYRRTSEYDAAITQYLEKEASSVREEPDMDALAGLPESFELTGKLEKRLRYGENPHQQAALYGRFGEVFEQLQGKDLSYCNILDISSAAYLIGEFQEPTVGILKHTNPCGVASAESLEAAWELAFATDRQAPFGGIIVVNQVVTPELAALISEIWCEIIIAPGFSEEAAARFGKKKNLRLMRVKGSLGPESLQEVRSIAGGFLVQDRDQKKAKPDSWQVVTDRQPTQEEWDSMLFGWRVVKHVKSNAVLYTKGPRTLGIGAGQMSRVDSSRLAISKAAQAELDLTGSTMCSDALIPFADGLQAAAEAGATACVQTGGSLRDEEVVKAANAAGISMVFTGVRHFKH